jgi:hypothetical protein
VFSAAIVPFGGRFVNVLSGGMRKKSRQKLPPWGFHRRRFCAMLVKKSAAVCPAAMGERI